MTSGPETLPPLKPSAMRSLWQRLGGLRSVLALTVIFVIAAALSPRGRDGWPIFLTAGNLSNMVRQMAEIGVIALAMTFVILTAGIDLSVGSVLALAATVTAKLLTDWTPGVGMALHVSCAVGAALGLATLVGLVNGLFIAYFRVQPFVVTLATMIGVRGVAKWLTENNNIGLSFGSDGVSGRFADVLSQKGVVIGVFLSLAVICAVVLSRTTFGRYVRAVGDNAKASVFAGLPTIRIQVAVYMICGFMAGLAGVLHAAQNRQGNPNDGIAYELDAIAAVVIGGTALSGGKGSIFGTVVGTLTLGIITNLLGLLGADENIKWMTKAVIILAAVLVQQSNLFGIISRIVRRKQGS